jgi:hypothetical protein
MGEPRASKTAREVTFSEAMRRMDSRWRWISFSYNKVRKGAEET